MSFEKIDEYTKELKAIKHYDELEKQRDEALSRIDELLEANKKLKMTQEKLSGENVVLQKSLGEKETEVEGLRQTSGVKDKKAQSIKLEADGLRVRVQELEDLKVTAEGKTLSEAEKAFLEAAEDEVRRRANETFNSNKDRWEKSEKPEEVSDQALKWLQHIIENLRKPAPRPFLKEVADVGLPERVEENIQAEVNRRLNTEFERRVEDESSKKALVKLEKMKKEEWSSWFRLNVEPSAEALKSTILTNALRLLKGPWTITCDKCGTVGSKELTPREIQDLLLNMPVTVECINPKCMDWLVRHRLLVNLGQLISYRITH